MTLDTGTGGPVTVRMFGALHTLRRERGLPTVVEAEVPEDGMSARDLARQLDLPVERIEGVFVNRIVYGLDHPVRPGDRVAFVPEGTPGPHRFFLGLYQAGRESKGVDGR